MHSRSTLFLLGISQERFEKVATRMWQWCVGSDWELRWFHKWFGPSPPPGLAIPSPTKVITEITSTSRLGHHCPCYQQASPGGMLWWHTSAQCPDIPMKCKNVKSRKLTNTPTWLPPFSPSSSSSWSCGHLLRRLSWKKWGYWLVSRLYFDILMREPFYK